MYIYLCMQKKSKETETDENVYSFLKGNKEMRWGDRNEDENSLNIFPQKHILLTF